MNSKGKKKTLDVFLSSASFSTCVKAAFKAQCLSSETTGIPAPVTELIPNACKSE